MLNWSFSPAPVWAVVGLLLMINEVGEIDLDKTFEERTIINSAIVNAINEETGQAEAIRAIAGATVDGLKSVA
jgi:hypothetical protein